MYKIQRYC